MFTFVATVALAAFPEYVESVPFPLPLFNTTVPFGERTSPVMFPSTFATRVAVA